MNTEKTLKNSLISVMAQVATLLLKFINRRIFIIFLEVEYLGYQTLFTNIFSLLSVAELGIGSIISFHLYKEVVDNNEQEIGKLMYLYKLLYRIIAIVVLVTGIGFCFLLPYFVKDANASWQYLYIVYFLQLAGVVMGYFLSYRRTIYIVTQQEYKCVQIDLYVNIIVQVIQLILLALLQNYIIYLCLQISITIIANIVIAIKSNKEFPYLKKKYIVTKQDIEKRNMFSDISNFIVHQISYAVYGGTDNIIISAFCGIRNVALYGNYILVQTGVMQICFYKLLNPVQATIGNIVYSDRRKEDLWEQFKILDVFSFFFASYIGLGFFIFYQPFIELWMGKEYLLSNTFVALFSITIYLQAVWEIVYKYRTVFGDYKHDRNYMVASAIINIIISIFGAKYFGVSGVQFGTLISFLPIAFGRIRFVVKKYFKQPMYKYIFLHMKLLLLVLSEGGICYFLIKNIPVSVIGLIIRCFVWLLVPLIINISVYYRNPYFKKLIVQFNKIIKIIYSKIKA